MALTLTNDFVFKVVFGQEATTDILVDLVNAVLEDEDFPSVVSLVLNNPVNVRQTEWLKETNLDIKATDSSGRQFDVEMQVSSDPAFASRSLYYWARQYSDQLGSGEAYRRLRPVVCINILASRLFDELPEIHNCFMIKHIRRSDVVLTGDLSIHFVELDKPVQGKERFRRWMEYFRNEGGGDGDMQVLLRDDMILRKAHGLFEGCTQDPELRERALAREKFLRDQLSRMEAARLEGLKEGQEEGKREGIKEGIKEGKKQGVLETAARMKGIGIELTVIGQATGLSAAEIEAL